MTQPPAGFYSDPQDPSQERWWDGQQWAATVRPKVQGSGGPAAGSPSGEPQPGEQAPSDQTSGGATSGEASPSGESVGRPEPAGSQTPPPPGGAAAPPPPPPPYGQPAAYGQPGAAAPQQGGPAANSGYYIAAWVTAFICCALVPIVLNVMDNNQRKAQGLVPRYGPTITAIVVNVVGSIIYLIAAGASSGGGSS